MGVKTGFIRTLLVVMVVGMLSACSSIGAQISTPHRHIRPQPRVSVQFYLGHGYYYPQYYYPHRHVIIHRHVVPERGVVYKSRVTPRPNPQRSRSMNQRPERRPERQRPQRPRRQRNDG